MAKTFAPSTGELSYNGGKIYTVKEVEWNVKSDDISHVTFDEYARTYTIHLKVNKDKVFYNPQIQPWFFETFFKREFPEHALSVEVENEISIPF